VLEPLQPILLPLLAARLLIRPLRPFKKTFGQLGA
jgi:hypothetical protein